MQRVQEFITKYTKPNDLKPNDLKPNNQFILNKISTLFFSSPNQTKEVSLLQSLGEEVGDSIIDQIILTPFESLEVKIVIFNHAATTHKKDLVRSLPHLLVMSYIADKQFYDHLEKLILKLDDIIYFPEKYSYNPYQSEKELLVEAVSHLLNIVIKREVSRPQGIEYMQQLIQKYSYLIQYKHICKGQGIQHPIFYLVEAKMWQELQNWVKQDPGILMMSDFTGKTPLITTILTFAHGYVKQEGHDKLLELQQCCILQYIQGDMYKMFEGKHKIIEPQIGLFIGYLEYDKAKIEPKHEIFIRTTKFYYKSLIETFIQTDQKLQRYSFLQARIDRSILNNDGGGMISFLSLMLQSIELSNNPIIVSEEQINALPQGEFIVDLYSGFIIKDKVNERWEKILDEMATALEKYKTNSLDQLKIGKDNLVARMFDDYLKICYSDLKYKKEIADKLYNSLSTFVKNQYFNPIDFIIHNAETFKMICTMGCVELLSAFKDRIIDYVEQLNFLEIATKNDISALLRILIPNAITTTWFSHKDNSDEDSYESFLKVAVILNMIIRSVSRCIEKSIVLIAIQDKFSSYLSCKLEKANIHTSSDLDLKFEDGKFNLLECDDTIDYKDHIIQSLVILYNFYSAFLIKKLYFETSFEYSDLFESTYFTPKKEKSLFSRISDIFKKPEDIVPIENNIVKGIKLCLLYLSNKHNQFTLNAEEEDEHLSQLFDLFIRLKKDHPIFDSINIAVSDLWEDIRMIGAQRIKLLLNFFFQHDYLKKDEHNIACITTRCIKSAILTHDFAALAIWLNDIPLTVALDCFRYQQQDYKSIATLRSYLMVVHHALIQSVGLNIPRGLETILKQHPRFLTFYNDLSLFDQHITLPFAIVRKNSQSEMMEFPEFRASLNKMAVMMLEYGYPIKLIQKKYDDLNVTSFITNLFNEQAQYSLKRLATNYLDLLPIPFISQLKSAANLGLAGHFYLQIYNKSLDFLHRKIQGEGRIDIGGFCHIFSSALQPEDFLSRLKKITFFSGLREEFNPKDYSGDLMRNAKAVASVVSNNISTQKFILIWHTVMNRSMNFKEICDYLKENEEVPVKIDVNKTEITFFHYLYKKSQKQDLGVALFKMKQATSMQELISVLAAQIGAIAITGTFMYFNNSDARNTLAIMIPTIYVGLTVAGSISSAVFSMVSSTFTSLVESLQGVPYPVLCLILTGTAIYGGYKIYQGINNEKIVKLNLEMLEKLVNIWHKVQEKKELPLITDEIQIYHKMSKLFKAYTGNELMDSKRFFSVVHRFGITSSQLDHAMHNLKNDFCISDSITTIVYAMSFAAIYMNVQRIKPFIAKVDSASQQKFQTLLHAILVGNMTNIKLTMKDHGIQQLYSAEIAELLKYGIPVLSHSYDPKKSDHYVNIWTALSNDDTTTLKMMNEKSVEFLAQFIVEFIVVLFNEMKNKSEHHKSCETIGYLGSI